ncbi:zinc ribbon domain-containing protein [Leifsonia sp. H3M29-4]|uniref:FmdB family zinc ribbon protein n=1 Tax=Salinibacterium metalliresistens TaxID=3031321 RepID=UPI0023D9ABC4|nr:FmdB family zinc ribbon protein [Salinibacterium metalliresistens]MDF1478093.1 zinc ribbon domain-containing protein [Salinibacterium metalliresistens]
MPTYSYRCTECGTAFDIQQAFTDDTLTECPTCHGPLRKLFNTVGVTFNGSGFYRTDSRAKPSDSSSASSSSSSSERSSSKKKESAPAPAASSSSSSSGSASSS